MWRLSRGGSGARRRSWLAALSLLVTGSAAGWLGVGGLVQPAGAASRVASLQVGSRPDAIALAPDGQSAYVANVDDGSVSVVGVGQRWALRDTISVGGRFAAPSALAVSPDGGALYVADDGSNSLRVVSTDTGALVATIPVGANPSALVVTPDGRQVYVANAGSNSVSVVSTASNAVTATILVGRNPAALTLTPDGRQLYVANLFGDTVSVIATATSSLTATVPVGTQPDALAATPDGQEVYVANQGNDTLSVIKTAGAAVQGAPIPVGRAPDALAVGPNGQEIYVAGAGDDSVSSVSTLTDGRSAVLHTGRAPESLAVAPGDRSLYVVDSLDDTLEQISLGLVQSGPGSVAVPQGRPFVGDLAMSGATGATRYAVTMTSPDLTVSPDGTVEAPASDPAGVYVIGGVAHDAAGASGPWAFSLTVEPATHLALSVPAPVTLGVPTAVTVRALDAGGATVPDFSDPVRLASEGGTVQIPEGFAWSGGLGTCVVVFEGTGPTTLTAIDTANATITSLPSVTVIENPPPRFSPPPPPPPADQVAHFSVRALDHVQAGTPLPVTITALEGTDRVATGAGPIRAELFSSDAQAILPHSVTLTHGAVTFSMTFGTVGTQTVTATDAADPAVDGISLPVTVVAAPPPTDQATRISVVANGRSASVGAPIEVAFSPVDAAGQVVANFDDPVAVTSTDGRAILPGSLLTGGAGGSFPVTFETPGAQTVTITDTANPAIDGTSLPVVVQPADHLSVSLPSAAAVGVPVSATVTVLDATNHVVTGFTDPVVLSGLLRSVLWSGSIDLSSGSGITTVTFEASGPQTVTFVDTANQTISGTSNVVNVSLAGAPASVVRYRARTGGHRVVLANDRIGWPDWAQRLAGVGAGLSNRLRWR